MSIRRTSTSFMTMTLCPYHLSFYMDRPDDYEVIRLSPWNGPISACTKCNRFGYDYLITEKARS